MSADLALLIEDPAAAEHAADPAIFVMQACERAKAWLREVLEHGDIEQIAEIKSQAEAVRVYTMQKQLGKDAELAAAEIVRRAERGIGVAIRKGQENGEIRSRGQSRVSHQPGTNRLEDRATRALGGASGGVNGLLGKAETLRKQTGNPKAHCVAAAAVELINRGRGGKKLPSWWRSDKPKLAAAEDAAA